MTSWTEDEEKLVRQWWGKFSASEISAKLRGLHSRNSVIGLVHRRRVKWGVAAQPNPAAGADDGKVKRRVGRPIGTFKFNPPILPIAPDPAMEKIVNEETEFRTKRLAGRARVIPFSPPAMSTAPDKMLEIKEDAGMRSKKRTATFDYRSDRLAHMGISLAHTNELHCRWPSEYVGSDRQARCCGDRIQDGSSYCPEHTRRAWAKHSPRMSADEIKIAVTRAPVVVELKSAQK